MLRKSLILLVVLFLVVLGVVLAAGSGWFGERDGPGEIVGARRPENVDVRNAGAVAEAAREIGVSRPKQVLFGDFHVHTTISFDAFMTSLPALGGEGAHPPADACDFARYCSALDFWSINDHAEAITPEDWTDTVDSIRACTDRAGPPDDPDLVSFLGWEWTQVGTTPEDHYGHKNVVLPGLADDEIPARPIAATGRTLGIRLNPPGRVRTGILALGGGGRFQDMARYFEARRGQPFCPDGVDVRELPSDCLEVADTPAVLFRKLREWNLDSLVIPHGTTWGFYTPARSSWDKQLAGDMHDPQLQSLLEVYSGHGDSEVYRSWRAVDLDADGNAVCPEPRPDYLPSCWQAGEIIHARCIAAGDSAEECDARRLETRRLAAEAGIAAHLVVEGEAAAEWLDAGQCRDCREPAFGYRPGGSAQYILALGNFDDGLEDPRRFRMGFLSSSDNHYARPGTGFKEKNRAGNTESSDRRSRSDSRVARLFRAPPQEPSPVPTPFDIETTKLSGFQLVELERQSSFFMTGGLVAVHSEGRDRASIWDAVKAREVYGTSGPRILMWFDLMNPPGSSGDRLPMGGEVAMSEAPIFQVRAVGSFEQLPGCPSYATEALDPASIERLCKGECYNPSDERRRITRIEVVRIRPQTAPDEDIAQLIDDPWRVFECEPSPHGCSVTFSDPEFGQEGRETVYYARAFEEPAPGINAGGVNCERDDEGNCLRARLCEGGDCLAEHEPRAWSSPIYVDFASSR